VVEMFNLRIGAEFFADCPDTRRLKLFAGAPGCKGLPNTTRTAYGTYALGRVCSVRKASPGEGAGHHAEQTFLYGQTGFVILYFALSKCKQQP
jgi:hypothetical protein